MLENLDLVLLAMDETVDGGCAVNTLPVCASTVLQCPGSGMPQAWLSQDRLPGLGIRMTTPNPCGRLILETDPSTIASRVAMRGADTDVPLSEQVCTPVRLLSGPMACLFHSPGEHGLTHAHAPAASQPDLLQGTGNRQGADRALAPEVIACGLPETPWMERSGWSVEEVCMLLGSNEE